MFASSFLRVSPDWPSYTAKEREAVLKNMQFAFDELKLPADAPEVCCFI